MRKWRFIDSGTGSAAWNMAVDEALLRSFSDGDMPIFRLYRWEKPSLSFGRFSRPKEVIDWDRMEDGDISFVRRITGGGILVHGGDVSYALIVPRSFVREKGVKASYRHLCAFLLHFYRQLGHNAASAQELQIGVRHTPVCLAGTEAYDILLGDDSSGTYRKIGGNAQFHTRNALLQHGSIPLRIDTALFGPLFLEDSGLSETATLEEMQRAPDEKSLTGLLRKAFTETFDTILQYESLRDEEQKLARKLFDEKYNREAWNVDAKSPIVKT